MEGTWYAHGHREHHSAVHQEQSRLVVLVSPPNIMLADIH